MERDEKGDKIEGRVLKPTCFDFQFYSAPLALPIRWLTFGMNQRRVTTSQITTVFILETSLMLSAQQQSGVTLPLEDDLDLFFLLALFGRAQRVVLFSVAGGARTQEQ